MARRPKRESQGSIPGELAPSGLFSKEFIFEASDAASLVAALERAYSDEWREKPDVPPLVGVRVAGGDSSDATGDLLATIFRAVDDRIHVLTWMGTTLDVERGADESFRIAVRIGRSSELGDRTPARFFGGLLRPESLVRASASHLVAQPVSVDAPTTEWFRNAASAKRWTDFWWSACALEAVDSALADEQVASHRDVLRAPLESVSPADVESMFWGLDSRGKAFRLFGDEDPKMRGTMRHVMSRIAASAWSGFSPDDHTRAGRIVLWLDGDRAAALKGVPPAPMPSVDPRPGIVAAILGWAFMIWLYWTMFRMLDE